MAKILVVEDNEDILNLVKIILEVNNHDVLTASDGHEAIKLMENKPDLVLLDIMMPGMSGWDVLDIIRSRDKWKNTPVIALTALAQKKDIETGVKKHVDGYIVKPFEKKELLNIINKVLGEHPNK
ncbi:response regulator [Methanothermococcus okinawensis]|uniref:Response regulator receiver protein n=1 Tax=Methanothermococcus okinawensis (strain DSM 14208 / JCM 11175 / IH1) TaxID=647113 RepID=F8AN86_METOI|nr:response regulator transcription factor [Methanothermococcus okinawensis]AEH07007.1 response regulator receiver protein [Methanothermococcus okinawensis IH1]